MVFRDLIRLCLCGDGRAAVLRAEDEDGTGTERERSEHRAPERPMLPRPRLRTEYGPSEYNAEVWAGRERGVSAKWLRVQQLYVLAHHPGCTEPVGHHVTRGPHVPLPGRRQAGGVPFVIHRDDVMLEHIQQAGADA